MNKYQVIPAGGGRLVPFACTLHKGGARMIHNPVRKQLPALSNPGAAGDLRSGKQLVGADGSVVSGALAEVQQAVPTISVSSGGLITASAKQSGGIIAAGSESATQQLPTQGAATITPGTTEQIAVPTQTYTTGAVKVAGDANLKAENIAEGVSIFGVQGAHSGQEFATCTVTNQSDNALVNLYYINGDKSSLISIYPGTYNKKVIVNKYSFFIVTSFISPNVSGSVEDVSVNLGNGKILFVTGNFGLVIR